MWSYTKGTRDIGQEVRCVGIDDFADTKIPDYDICVFAFIPEHQIFWLEVAVDDARLVKVFDRAEDGPDKIRSIPVVGGEVRTRAGEKQVECELFRIFPLGVDAVSKGAAVA